jgi:hypothetical protein
MSRVIIVGRRRDNGHRDRLWDVCRQWWEKQLGWPIFEGHHDDGPFCLSIAANRAARLAEPWTVALYIGADWLALTTAQVEAAAHEAERTGRMTFAHDTTVHLERPATMRFLAGEELSLDEAPSATNTLSGVVAIPRAAWDAVGGYDERFVGWGGEDISFWCACCAVTGYGRVPGTIVHLWHHRRRADNEEHPDYPANDELMRRYLANKNSRNEMLQILREPNAPFGPREE